MTAKKGRKRGRTAITFDEAKRCRNIGLTDAAIHWLDDIANANKINRNDVIELWARNSDRLSIPNISKAISLATISKKASQPGRTGFDFGEFKEARNFALTDTAVKWLDNIADTHKINRNDVIEFFARDTPFANPKRGRPLEPDSMSKKNKAWSMSAEDWQWLESQPNQSEVIRQAISLYRASVVGIHP